MQMIINNDNCLDMMIVLNLPQPMHTNPVLFFGSPLHNQAKCKTPFFGPDGLILDFSNLIKILTCN